MATVKLWKAEISRGLLPDVCIRDGVPATTTHRRTFRWYPPWVTILVLVSPLIWLIVAAILTKRMTIDLPVCDEYLRRRRVRLWVAWAPLAGFFLVFWIGVAVLGSADRNRDLADLGGGITAVGAIAFFVWLIVAAILTSIGVRPTEITDRTITLSGVSDEFVDALEEDRDREEEEEREYEDRRRDRRRSRRDAYDD